MKPLAALAFVLLLASRLTAAGDPVGVWNLKIRVGNIGEGTRVVLLKVEREGESLTAKITGLQHDWRDVDAVRFANGTLTIEYGAYTYVLRVKNDEVRGTVQNPAGRQEVSGTRQAGLLYVGDNPEPLAKSWTGVIGHRRDGAPPEKEPHAAGWVRGRVTSPEDFALVSRRTIILFTNAKAHESALQTFAGQTVEVTGTWRIDRIEINRIAPAPPR